MTFDELLKAVAGTDVEFIVGVIKRRSDATDAEQMRRIEASIGEVIAAVGEPGKPRKKRKTSHTALKRKAFKHCISLDADSAILAQVRTLGR